jgi:hypothetical protein
VGRLGQCAGEAATTLAAMGGDALTRGLARCTSHVGAAMLANMEVRESVAWRWFQMNRRPLFSNMLRPLTDGVYITSLSSSTPGGCSGQRGVLTRPAGRSQARQRPCCFGMPPAVRRKETAPLTHTHVCVPPSQASQVPTESLPIIYQVKFWHPSSFCDLTPSVGVKHRGTPEGAEGGRVS